MQNPVDIKIGYLTCGCVTVWSSMKTLPTITKNGKCHQCGRETKVFAFEKRVAESVETE